jgi:hypothetical protein
MSKGDFEDEDNFRPRYSPTHRIVWTGSSKKVVKIVVTCNLDLESLEDGIMGTIFDDRGWETGQCDICENKGRCCLIALRTP